MPQKLFNVEMKKLKQKLFKAKNTLVIYSIPYQMLFSAHPHSKVSTEIAKQQQKKGIYLFVRLFLSV